MKNSYFSFQFNGMNFLFNHFTANKAIKPLRQMITECKRMRKRKHWKNKRMGIKTRY